MLAALIAPVGGDILFERQPTSMEVIGYQRVKVALPNGTPDLKAADNSFVRTKTQWFLVVDSDTLPVDEQGNHHVVFPALKNLEYRRVEESGRIRGGLAKMFTEVAAPDRRERGKTLRKGANETTAMEFDRPAKQRVMLWRVRSIVERTETHTEGRHRVTRTLKETYWSTATQGWYAGKPFIPDREPKVAMEPMPHVQVDPPTFGFGTVQSPADDDF